MLEGRLKRWADFMKKTPFHPQWLLRFSPSKGKLLEPASGVVLDIGCADGWPAKSLREGCTYIGLDYPPTGAGLYRAKPDVFADAAALPFADESFDTVLLFEVLEHVERPQQTLTEISRVLKPGGQLLLSMPFLYPMHDEPHDYQRYTYHGLQREICKAGLQMQRIQSSLHSAATGGLLMNLALGGMGLSALQKRSFSVVMLPLLALVVLAINALAYCGQFVLPSWRAMTNGYIVIATKP